MALRIRPADPSVTPPPRVVGGREAAPPEWQAWSEEPGVELVATDDGHVVGGIHVSMVGRGQAWMECLRVDPAARGRGIAGQLVREAEAVARRYGAAVMRAGIPSGEYAGLAVAERAGYRPLARCAVVVAAAAGVAVPVGAAADVLPASRASEVMHLARASPTLAAWQGVIPLGWRFRRLVPELVRGLARDRRVVVARHPASADLAVAVYAHRGEAVVLSWVDGPPDGQQAVVGWVMEQVRPARLVAFTPDLALLAFLPSSAWQPHPWCPDGLVVVHKSLAS
jgi:GNAT superfamily N-acetyltransferase